MLHCTKYIDYFVVQVKMETLQARIFPLDGFYWKITSPQVSMTFKLALFIYDEKFKAKKKASSLS